MHKVIITGGNGFLGSHIIEYFLNQGQNISCLLRRNSSTKNLTSPAIDVVEGDITDLHSLIKAFRGYHTVIHNAAFSRDWGDLQEFYKVNVEGTLHVLQACVENNIKNIIMTGSVSSYGEENNQMIKNEKSAMLSHYHYFLDSLFPNGNNYYRDTKAEATRKAMEFATTNNLNLTILEPVWIYGERDLHGIVFTYLDAIRDKIPFFPGTKKNKFHLVYAVDVARAFFIAYQKQLTGVHKIIIGNTEAEYMDVIFQKICDNAGYKKPMNVPKFLLYPVGFILELIYSLLKSKNPPLLTRSRVAMFYDNIEYSTENAREMLRFENEYSLDRGIKKTIDWFRVNNYL